jgi:tRNA modification GTPase
MSITLDDTIAAIATVPGAAERGVLRLTGPNTDDVVRRVFRQHSARAEWCSARVPSRFAGEFSANRLRVAVSGFLCWWPTKRSYTGQPVAEIHVPGAQPILEALLEELTSVGARIARPGEFTLRAFLAGRIDLLQAEAVLGVIEATDHDQLQQALSQLGGSITKRMSCVREDLVALLGDLEAGLDFVEEDIQFVRPSETIRRIQQAANAVQELTQTTGERLPSNFRRRVVLAGLPNAGKSTLFNAIARQQRALVSSVAGTTRDYLSAVIDLDGMPIELVDTAGWERAGNAIEGQAQNMRARQVQRADLVVWCRAPDVTVEQLAMDDDLNRYASGDARCIIRVDTCSDRVACRTFDSDALWISALHKHNLDILMQRIRGTLSHNNATRDELLGATTARCRESLIRASACLLAAAESVSSGFGDEITALELRQALHEIATVLGDVYTDDILDHIFSSFCIGK